MTLRRTLALALFALALFASTVGVAATAATAPTLPESKGVGFGLGPLVPAATLSKTNDLGLYAILRGFYYPDESHHGVRAAVWAGGLRGKSGIDDGYGWGGEMDYSARFGGGPGPFYLFVGVGFGGSQFVAVHGSYPGGTQIKIVGTAGYAHAGIGYRWKRVFLEASYLDNFDDQASYGLVPVVVGVTF
jgi:hypothetical protein